MPETLILRLLVGAGLGFVVGLERQLHVRVGEAYAGARTFALIGVWGVATASLADWVGPEAFVAGLLVFGAVEVSSYLALSKKTGDVGTTTEMAALATFFVGVLAGRDSYEVAAALAVGMAVLLRSKEYLRTLAGRFEQEDVAAVLQFGVVTAVILPLAPDRGFGPFAAINPHEIWLMVVLVSAIGLAGYLALRLLGSRGLGLTGLLGGLISSTAVTMSFSKMARRRRDLTNVLAAGVLAASGLMFGRVLVEATVVSPRLAAVLAAPMALMLVAVEAAAYLIYRRRRKEVSEEETDLAMQNPVTLTVALQFGLLYGVVVFLGRFLVEKVSASSLALLGAVSGITDVDAITLSSANLVNGGVDVVDGARAVLAAVTVNGFVKGGMAVVLGSRRHALWVGVVLGVASLVTGAWLLLL